ncbi:4-hydroxy-tetrahydrodipicolinate reductase [Porcipelethomonas sp.]|uniref:4-hydroxy-tetrahydrodipicolinate reductase n=1 Tax=Porcipelethomonas sp. TaxID=2981675 RepID=UPI003EF8B2CD
MTKIVICGANGKMGQTIYRCVKDRSDCEITGGIDINTQQYADFPIYSSVGQLPEKPDVIIDYSHPSCLTSLLEYCMTTGTPVVLATTGYSDEQISEIKKASSQIPVFFSWNMSLGINLLVELAKKATAILGDKFDIEIVEKHHNQKIDSPSGTALMIANAINETRNNEMKYVYDRHSQRKKREANEIGIHSVRGGTIVGVHEVIFAGNDETITISHSAASKTVFAEGSVNAALYIKSLKAGLYDMNSIIG